jgi:hypothetical protein
MKDISNLGLAGKPFGATALGDPLSDKILEGGHPSLGIDTNKSRIFNFITDKEYEAYKKEVLSIPMPEEREESLFNKAVNYLAKTLKKYSD